ANWEPTSGPLESVELLFFLQAEDGIRDFHVTGVQTCALPIYKTEEPIKTLHLMSADEDLEYKMLYNGQNLPFSYPARHPYSKFRSEERRVGKECRSRRAPYQGRQ